MKKLKYYKNLDGLRALAALSVLIYHFFGFTDYNGYPAISTSIKQLAETGKYGVTIFFVLSGFVITRILINNIGEKNYFKSFYVKRILRILPLYYLFLLVWFFIRPLVFSEAVPEFSSQWSAYFFLQNTTILFGIPWQGPYHYWTLVIEEQFYLIWPVIIFFFYNKNFYRYLLFGILVIAVLKQFILTDLNGFNHFTFSKSDQLCAGALLALLETKGFFENSAGIKKITYSLSSVIFISSVMYLFWRNDLIKDTTIYVCLLTLLAGVLFFLIITPSKFFINKLLSIKPMLYLGKLSFGLYVWGALIQEIYLKKFPTKIIVLDFFLSISLSVLTAHISYFYFESYFLKFRNKAAI